MLVVQSRKQIITLKCQVLREDSSTNNKLRNEIIGAKIKKRLVKKSNLFILVRIPIKTRNQQNYQSKQNKKTEQDKLVKLEMCDLSYFASKNCFGYVLQIYVCLPINNQYVTI